MSPLWLAVFVLIAALAFVVITFNDLVAARNLARAAWSNIDVQLQRRHDLVPQLVATVKAYADHERTTLSDVVQLRNQAQVAAPIARRGQIESELAARISRLLALQEQYPDLKASENFLQLQRDLVDVEDHLQVARQSYNEVVRQFNTRVENFPELLLARPLGFQSLDFFQAQDRDAVSV
ncbi:MAG TPA: LemA family protein [Rudaea sp.]|nr:LemA family protein [Rudaea sp.]